MEKITYHFNVEEIRKQIKAMEHLLNSYTLSGRAKRSLESTLKDYKASLLPLLYPKRATSLDSETVDSAYLITSEDILSLPQIVEDSIWKSLPILVGKQNNLTLPNFKEEGYCDDCFLTNHEIVELVQDFYKETFHIDIRPMLRDKENHSFLQFDYCKDSPFNFFGTTYLNPFDFKHYINVIRFNKIEDLIATAHEVCHMLHLTKPFFSTTDVYFLGEADTMFTEKLFLDFLKKKGIYHEDLIDAMQFDYLYDACTNATSIAMNFALDGRLNFHDVKRKTIGEYFRKNKWSFPFTKEEALSYQEGNTVDVLRNTYQNLFCYYTALDLYHEYEIDPEKAIYHYQLFGKIPTYNIPFFLHSIGTTFQDGNYDNLKVEVKKYTKKK